jgi:hypothetical protein
MRAVGAVLSREQINLFNKHGFLLVPSLLSPSQKKNLVRWTEEVEKWPETAGKWMQYFENRNGTRLLCRTEKYFDFHPQIRDLVYGPILQAVAQLMDEAACVYKEKINYKYAGGAGFEPHQDAPAYVSTKQRYHITAMIAIDPMTKENGALEVVKGEHTKGMFPHPGGVMEHKLCQDYERRGMWELIHADVGDTMLFHSYLPHRSGPNKTNSSRRAHYITFNPLADGDHRDFYYADKRAKFPPDIERIPGVDYSEGGRIYNVANPISSKS